MGGQSGVFYSTVNPLLHCQSSTPLSLRTGIVRNPSGGHSPASMDRMTVECVVVSLNGCCSDWLLDYFLKNTGEAFGPGSFVVHTIINNLMSYIYASLL